MGDTPAVVKCFAADVVEAIDVLEERFGDLIAGRPMCRQMSSACENEPNIYPTP